VRRPALIKRAGTLVAGHLSYANAAANPSEVQVGLVDELGVDHFVVALGVLWTSRQPARPVALGGDVISHVHVPLEGAQLREVPWCGRIGRRVDAQANGVLLGRVEAGDAGLVVGQLQVKVDGLGIGLFRALAGSGTVLRREWPDMSTAERRRVLAAAIDRITVSSARIHRRFRGERFRIKWRL
jgi:hypothetical protein